MTKKKKVAVKEGQKGFPNKKLLFISVFFALLIIFSAVAYRLFLGSFDVKFPLRAVIVDQVGANYPSSHEEMQRFNQTVSSLLKSVGFDVRYYGSESVTVDLYRRLVGENYGIIILRVHSATREDKTLVDFFTSEKYKPDVYSAELNNGLLTLGNYSWLPGEYYFAITPKFVEALEGNFPGSIVIAMGCSSLKQECEEMADAFINKGAKVYIGWTDMVSITHSDNSTIRFLQQFLNSKTINEAINECNKFEDPDLYYLRPSAKLSYRLKESKIANYRLSDFIANLVLSGTFHSAHLSVSAKLSKLFKTFRYDYVEFFPQNVS